MNEGRPVPFSKQAENDSCMRDGVTAGERDRIKALERENLELRQANEILHKASVYFAQAQFDRSTDAMIGFIDSLQGHVDRAVDILRFVTPEIPDRRECRRNRSG